MEISKFYARIADYLIMSAERQGSNPANVALIVTEQPPISIRNRFHGLRREIKSKAVLKGFELVSPITRMGMENIMRHVPVEYEKGFDEEIKAARERGDVLLFVTNHESLADPIVALKPLRRIRRMLGHLKIALPYIITINDGNKGDDLHGLSDTMAPVFEAEEVDRIFLSRDKDQEKYHTEANLLHVYKEIKEHIIKGHDLLIHAEGTVSGARRNETGERNGMLPIETNSLRTAVKIADKLGKRVTVVPMTISGSFNIFDPALGAIDHQINETRGALTRNALRVGLNFSDTSLARVSVLKPMDATELIKQLGKTLNRMTTEDWDRFNGFIGRKIASRLPRKMQGVYANDETFAAALEELKAERLQACSK